MRTAYRPVDMVFSIMGLLGVDLDPSRFGAHDRTPALVEMMQKLLAKGNRAEWLAIVPLIAGARLVNPACDTETECVRTGTRHWSGG